MGKFEANTVLHRDHALGGADDRELSLASSDR